LRFDEIVEGQVIVMNSKEIHGPIIRKASRISHKEVFFVFLNKTAQEEAASTTAAPKCPS
jgi:hypothetical protein